MRGQLRHVRLPKSEGSLMSTEWKVSAIVAQDSVQFAADMEKVLNDRSTEGFELVHMLTRPAADNGIVLVHQKHTFEIPGPATPMPAGERRN